MKHLFTSLILLLLFPAAFAQTVTLVDTLQGNEKLFTEFNGELYFARNDSVFKVSPSVNEVEFVVKLDMPVLELGISEFPTTTDNIFFITGENLHEFSYALWMSDGTASGTKTILSTDTLYQFTEFNNQLHFIAGYNPLNLLNKELYYCLYH